MSTITPADLAVGDLLVWPNGSSDPIIAIDVDRVYSMRNGKVQIESIGVVCWTIETNRRGHRRPVPHPAALADLYEACKELVKFFDGVRPSGRVLKSDPDIDAARAALAKAGGNDAARAELAKKEEGK